MNGQSPTIITGIPGLFAGLIVVGDQFEQTAGQGVISSLTRSGAQIQSTTPMHKGDQVRLFLPHESELQGVVTSCEGDVVGVKFDNQLSAPLLRKLESLLTQGEKDGRAQRSYNSEVIERNRRGAVRDRHLILIVPFAIAMQFWFWGVDLAQTLREKLTGSHITRS